MMMVAQLSRKKNGPNRIIYWQAQFFAATSYMTIITCPKFICSRDVEILKRFVTTWSLYLFQMDIKYNKSGQQLMQQSSI